MLHCARMWNGSNSRTRSINGWKSFCTGVCFEKTLEVIKKCFDELMLHKVDLSGIILKPNMILDGSEFKK